MAMVFDKDTMNVAEIYLKYSVVSEGKKARAKALESPTKSSPEKRRSTFDLTKQKSFDFEGQQLEVAKQVACSFHEGCAHLANCEASSKIMMEAFSNYMKNDKLAECIAPIFA